MNISELLALIASEYSGGLEEAKAPLRAVAEHFSSNSHNVADLAPTRAFVERTRNAVGLLNLGGVVAFLEHVESVLPVSDEESSPLEVVSASWSLDALDVVGMFLGNGASADAAELIAYHAEQSPASPDPAWIAALRASLSDAPSLLSDDDETDIQYVEVSPQAISLDSSAADPELLSALLADAPRQLERMRDDLLHYAGASSPSSGSLAESQRIAHTLKGSGNIVGLPGIANIAHPLEDLLVWLDSGDERNAEAQALAVRDALVACDVLQQSIAYLNAEEAPPTRALMTLERMQAWAIEISAGEANAMRPPPIEFAAETDATQVTPSELTPATLSDTAVLRVDAARIGSLVTRLGQSLASAQRTSRAVREIEERLAAAMARQAKLRQQLDELQRVVERQAVTLQQKQEDGVAFDPLEMDRFDALSILSRTLAETVQDQIELTREAEQKARETLTQLRDDERALREQHRDLLATRLVPFSNIVARLRRSVEQTASEVGKQARLVVRGERTTLDADVLSRLTEPLLHMLRNAVDHGIEAPEVRQALGKNPTGTVELVCARDGSQFALSCADDGRGIDEHVVHERAIRDGLLPPDAAFDSSQIHALILQRGFSTKDVVNQVSGRGIGMDVVAERIRAMKGSLAIQSEPNVGTRFNIQLPVSSGLAQSLIVEAASQIVAVPSDSIVAVLPAGSAFAENDGVNVRPYVRSGEDLFEVHSLAYWLGFAERPSTDDFKQLPVILARGTSGLVAIAVERVIDVRELVLQDVGALLRRVAGLGVGTIGDQGTPLFLIDIASLERRAESKVGLSAAIALRRRAEAARLRVLVVDDALSARRALQQSFEDRGFEVLSAGDGFEALEVLRQHRISLVATDLEMPNLNGLELARRMREVPDWASIPIVMVTSRGGDRHRQAALESGVDEYLVKPFANQQLIAAADALIANRRVSV